MTIATFVEMLSRRLDYFLLRLRWRLSADRAGTIANFLKGFVRVASLASWLAPLWQLSGLQALPRQKFLGLLLQMPLAITPKLDQQWTFERSGRRLHRCRK